MEKLNIAKLLKDCPKGMELDCALWDNVVLDHIDMTRDCPIYIRIKGDGYEQLTKYGQWNHSNNAKCIIFPKGKTTWEGFQRPFKDGDIVNIITENNNEYITIFKDNVDKGIETYIDMSIGNFKCSLLDSLFYTDNIKYQRLATQEGKEKLFKAIKDNGYKWNPESKTLEKLVKPRFKVGDRIILKDNPHNIPSIRIKAVTKRQYMLENERFFYIDSTDEKYVLEDKFDINTLKPFDKVLVRDNDTQEWSISLFSHYNGLKNYKYSCINGNGYAQCIPYKGNEHLLGTANDCDEYFKTW